MNYELEMIEVTQKQPAKIYHLYLPYYHYMKQHFHANIELVYVIKGSFIAHVNGVKTKVIADSLFLINTNEIHYFEMLEDSEMITILLSYEILKDYEPMIDDIAFDLSLFPQQHDHLKYIIKTMDTYRKGKEKYKDIKVQEYLCHICYLLLCYFQKKKENIHYTNMQLKQTQMILEYIENHYNQAISIQQMSDYFHYSPSYFCRYFKKMTGMSVYQYVKIIRLNHAFFDICNSQLEISQIAYEHGFSNPKAFIKAFKDKYHQTPGAYRQSIGQ